MSRDIMLDALEREIPFWPGVHFTLGQKGRLSHRRATLTFNGQSRWVGVSITPDRTAPVKMIADVKRTLKALGASRVDRKCSRREAEEVATRNELKFGVSPGSIVLTIPRKHKLFDRFMDGTRGKGHWKFELRSNPNLSGDPFVAIVEAKLPPGKQQATGFMAPSYNKATDTATVVVKPHRHPEIVSKIGQFRTTPVKLREDNGSGVVFELPPKSKRQPPILRGEARLEELTRPPEPEAIQEEQPSAIEVLAEVTRDRAMETIAPPAPTLPSPALQFPRVLELKPVQLPMDVEKCINYLNKMKELKGADLTFRMEEGGYISYIMKGGRR